MLSRWGCGRMGTEAIRQTGGWRRWLFESMQDEKALACTKGIAGKIELHEIGSLPKSERDALLHSMRAEGLSIKQVQRLTGTGISIIDHANRKRG